MNKIRLIAFLLFSAYLMQGCKKDTVTATVSNPSITLQALINGTTWAPDTISTSVTYNSAAKTKVFHCIATLAQKQVSLNIQLNNATSGNDFTLGTYTVDDTGNVLLQYSTQQKNAAGNYIFVQQGTVAPGSGTVVITAIDTVNNLITGTFSLVSKLPQYDSSGNITSIQVNEIASGVFNNLHYTYSAN